jgi:hypothetical protein
MVAKRTILTTVNAFCGEAFVQGMVCAPGTQLPPEGESGVSEREKVRRAIVDVCKEMNARRPDMLDPVSMRRAIRTNALGAAAKYTGRADLKAQYEESLEKWAPAPLEVEPESD